MSRKTPSHGSPNTDCESCDSGVEKDLLSQCNRYLFQSKTCQKCTENGDARHGKARKSSRFNEDRKSSCGSHAGKEDAEGDDNQRKNFACPFYKYDGMRYMSCARLRLTRIRDVKQHLNRRHRLPVHCPVCGHVFADSSRRDEHIRARDCQPSTLKSGIDGIGEDQAMALARRVNRSLNERNQWYSIWNILFRNSPPPPSPYLSNYFEETLDMVHDYWTRHGDGLVTELVRPAGQEFDEKGGSIAKNVSMLSTKVVGELLSRLRSHSRLALDPATSNPIIVESPPQCSAGAPSPLTTTATSSPELVPALLAPKRSSYVHSSLVNLKDFDMGTNPGSSLVLAQNQSERTSQATASVPPCILTEPVDANKTSPSSRTTATLSTAVNTGSSWYSSNEWPYSSPPLGYSDPSKESSSFGISVFDLDFNLFTAHSISALPPAGAGNLPVYFTSADITRAMDPSVNFSEGMAQVPDL